MDLYAAEAAFRTVHNKATTTERFGVLMGAMARSGRSEIANYFQGRKRACRTVDADGAPGEWRPPTRAERDLARRREGKAVTSGPLRPRRTAATWQSGFKYVSAAEFLASPVAVPDQPGVYTLLLEGGRELLSRCGYQCDGRPLITLAGHDHLYTGESYGMRTRLLQHLTGGFEMSPMRSGLLALHVEYGLLDDVLGLCSRRATTEAALSAWMEKKVLIGFRESPRARDYEADILKWAASPLNSKRAEAEGFLGILQHAKAQLAVVSDRWEPAPKIDYIRRRR